MSTSTPAAEATPTNPSNGIPDWTIWPLPSSPVLTQFAHDLPSILESTNGYNEMYGVHLQGVAEGSNNPPPVPTLILLQKYLRANENDLRRAKDQLVSALQWRREYDPLRAREEVFERARFASLGFVTRVRDAIGEGEGEKVVSWNVYGAAAREAKKVFGDTEGFIRWRVALMELTLAELHLNDATTPVPNYGEGPDPYTAINVHDYLSVSFFRQPAEIKASSSKIIDMFQRYYPETASQKYFVNVPLVMQWMMGAMKALMSKDSVQRMTWMTYGSELHRYLGSDVAGEYGGSGPALAEGGKTPRYDGDDVSGQVRKEGGEESAGDGGAGGAARVE